jgi:heat shock protein HslJ
MLASALTVSAQSWLDRPLTNWNRQGANLPELPSPAAGASELAIAARCAGQIRQPDSPAESAVARRGWKLYGPVQTYGTAKLFAAMAGVDGMCRPLGYQHFVYSEDRYAGTLSPVPMASRTDGSLINVSLISSTRIRAEFARYAPSDPLCCPSRISTVNYDIREDEIPGLTAVNVTTEEACRQAGSNSGASLFGVRWLLTEIRGQRISADKPYIELDRAQQSISGDAGCNRFAGGFEVNGQSLKLSRIIRIKRACLSPEANRLESDFLQALETTARFELENGTLRFYAGNSPILAFTKK